ncbi:hypothetical protein ACHAPJ_000864 [Fusarium lateritium]
MVESGSCRSMAPPKNEMGKGMLFIRATGKQRNGNGEVPSAIENHPAVWQIPADEDSTPNLATTSASSDGMAVSGFAHSANIGPVNGPINVLSALWDGFSPAEKPSKDMILNLRGLVLDQRLDAITSFEIIWDFAPWLEPRYSREMKKRLRAPRSDFESFKMFMDRVPRLFRNIRKLYIALQGDLLPESQGGFGSVYVPPEQRAKRTGEAIIKEVDEMAARLNPDVDLSVSFPTSIYARQRWRALQWRLKVMQRHETGDVERHWRPLEDDPLGTGYWFCLGEKDLKRKAAAHVLGPKVMPRKGRGKAYDVFFRPGPPCV